MRWWARIISHFFFGVIITVGAAAVLALFAVLHG